MTPIQQKFDYLRERMIPVLREVGVTGFVIVGYLEDGDKTKRFCFTDTCGNVAMEDALRPIIHFAGLWQAPAAEFGPPPGSNSNDGQKGE